jgi:hypothetical protein
MPRDCIIVERFIQIFIFESLGSQLPHLRIILYRKRLNINIVLVIDIEFDGNIRRKNEIGI